MELYGAQPHPSPHNMMVAHTRPDKRDIGMPTQNLMDPVKTFGPCMSFAAGFGDEQRQRMRSHS